MSDTASGCDGSVSDTKRLSKGFDRGAMEELATAGDVGGRIGDDLRCIDGLEVGLESPRPAAAAG